MAKVKSLEPNSETSYNWQLFFFVNLVGSMLCEAEGLLHNLQCLWTSAGRAKPFETIWCHSKTLRLWLWVHASVLFLLAVTFLSLCWHFQGVDKYQFCTMEERKIKRKSPRPSTNSQSAPPGTTKKNASSRNLGFSGMGTHSSQKTKYKRYVTSEHVLILCLDDHSAPFSWNSLARASTIQYSIAWCGILTNDHIDILLSYTINGWVPWIDQQ